MLTNMNTSRLSGALALTVLVASALLGCASEQPEPTEPTPTAEAANAAKQPCVDFAVLTDRTADLVLDTWAGDSETAADDLEAVPDEFDMVALDAEGAVGERMAETVAILQERSPIVMSTQPDEYFESLEAVQRACAAEDVTIDVATWK